MGATLLIDFGSTFTKIRAVDLERETLLGIAQAPSTADTDLTIGLEAAYRDLLAETGLRDGDIEKKFACSSAAGGLRIAVIGLVPNLTTDAARKAAFGAGGKVVAGYSNKLTAGDIADLTDIRPDLVLLAGGTDGGNEKVIRHNYQAIAKSGLSCPILYAGNKVVAEEAEKALRDAEKQVVVAGNILPEVNRLQLEPTHRAIRELFIEQIVHGKGLDKAEQRVGGIIMPTPMAVLQGAELLAKGTSAEEGLGDLVVVDVGGATTDTNSLAEWKQSQPDVMQKGLPVPYAFRTVEGDLGIRYNASHILAMVGEERVLASIRELDGEGCACGADEESILPRISRLTEQVEFTPQDPIDYLIDAALTYHAVRIAVERHAGRLQPHHTVSGTVYFQFGKDLTGVENVVATGGVFKFGRYLRAVLEAVRFDENNGLSLRPKQPGFILDESYLLFAAGLLAGSAPDAALRIIKGHLKPL
jgi:uncharacterized protein (TIGR01319 family)